MVFGQFSSILAALTISSFIFSQSIFAREDESSEPAMEMEFTWDPGDAVPASELLGDRPLVYYKRRSSQIYYIDPYPVLDLSMSVGKYKSKCEGAVDKTERHTFRYVIDFYTGDEDKALRKYLKSKKSRANINDHEVKITNHPSSRIHIILNGKDDGEKIVSTFPKVEEGDNLMANLLGDNLSAKSILTCDQAYDFLFDNGWRDMLVLVEVQTRAYSGIDSGIKASLFLTQTLKKRLDREENQTGRLRYSVSSSGSSGGLLGTLMGSSTRSRSTIGNLDTRKRYITADALNREISEYSSKISENHRVYGDAEKYETEINRVREMADQIKSLVEPITARFEKKSDCDQQQDFKGYCLIIGEDERRINNSEWNEIVDGFSKAVASNSASIEGSCTGNPSPEQAASKVAEKSSECELKAAGASESTINFIASGNSDKKFIPTKFKVYGVSDNIFSDTKVYELTRRDYVGKRGLAIKPFEIEDVIMGTSEEDNKLSKYVQKPLVYEVTLNNQKDTTISIDKGDLIRYCADDDGCILSLTSSKFEETAIEGSVMNHSVGTAEFFYDSESKWWRVGPYQNLDNFDTALGNVSAKLGDGTGVTIMKSKGCLFTEQRMDPNSGSLKDDDDRFDLLAHCCGGESYSQKGKVCKLIIRD